jgi:YggT family protein
MTDALVFLIDTFTRLYLLILLLRLWLPFLQANFRNPVAQGVLRYTSPLVVPVRRFVLSIGRVDTATILVALVIQMLTNAVVMLIHVGVGAIDRISANFLAFTGSALVDLAMLSVWLFIIALVIRVICSYMGRNYGPPAELLNELTEPLIRPIRRVIPPLGIIDLSTYITFVLLIALSMALSDLRLAY